MDERTVSRWFGAVSLVIGGTAVTVGSLFEVTGDDDSARTALSKIAAHQFEQRGLIVADMVAVLMLPAMLYLMRLARKGSPRLAVSGGVLAFAGWLAGLLGLGASDVVFYHAARAGDHAAAVSLLTAVTDDAATSVLVGVFLVGHLLGMLILGVALWRSRVVPLWAALLVGLAPIGHLFVHSAGRLPNAFAYALMTAGMGAAALALLRVANEEWDLPAVSSVSAHDRARSHVLAARRPLADNRSYAARCEELRPGGDRRRGALGGRVDCVGHRRACRVVRLRARRDRRGFPADRPRRGCCCAGGKPQRRWLDPAGRGGRSSAQRACQVVADAAFASGARGVPGPEAFALVSGVAGVFGVPLIGTLGVLLFPDGALPGALAGARVVVRR